MAAVAAAAGGSEPAASSEVNNNDLLKLQPVKVQKQNNRSNSEKQQTHKPLPTHSVFDAVPFTPSQGVRTPSPGIAMQPWAYSPFAAHAFLGGEPPSPNTVLRPAANGSDGSASSDSSNAPHPPLPPMTLHPMGSMGSMGYPPFMAVYHPLTSMGSWNPAGGPPEPGSPRNGGPPSPLMGSPVGTPTAMMFPQTPFAGAHHQPFSPYHHLPSAGPGAFGPDAHHHPLSPQGSGAYGYFHPIFNAMPAFVAAPVAPLPPRTHSTSGPRGQQAAGGSGSRAGSSSPPQGSGTAPAPPAAGSGGSQVAGGEPGGRAAGEGAGGAGTVTPDACSPDQPQSTPASVASRVSAGSPAPHGLTAAQAAALHAMYGMPAGGMPPAAAFYGFDPSLLAHMAAASGLNLAAGQQQQQGGAAASGVGAGHGSGAAAGGSSGYAAKRPPPLHVAGGAAQHAAQHQHAAASAPLPPLMMMPHAHWAGASGHVMAQPPPGMVLHLCHGGPTDYWDALHAMALTMSMGLMPPACHAPHQSMGADAAAAAVAAAAAAATPFEFPDLSNMRGGQVGLGMSPPTQGFMNAHFMGLPMGLMHHGTPSGAGIPPPPPPRSMRGPTGTLSAAATPSPCNPKARRSLQPTPGAGGPGSSSGPGVVGSGGGADSKSGGDATPRLNARQRRTLRRAKERAIKGLMEAGHLLLARTHAAAGVAGAGAGGDDSSGSDADDAQSSGGAGGAGAVGSAGAGVGGLPHSASMETYLNAAMSVAAGSHGPQAAADASAALSKVAAELEDMDIGDHGDIGDLISQLAARREEGLVDDGLIRDLAIIQNLMGALKLPLGGRSQPGAPQRTARAAHLPGTATPPAHSGSPDMAGGQMLRGGLPASGTSTPLPGKIAPIATAAAVAGGVGERTDATAVLHVASGATVGMVH